MKFSSLAALKVVKMTTSSAANDENFIKMMTFSFQCSFFGSTILGAENGPSREISANSKAAHTRRRCHQDIYINGVDSDKGLPAIVVFQYQSRLCICVVVHYAENTI